MRELSVCREPCSALSRRLFFPRISGQAMKRTERREDIFSLILMKLPEKERRRKIGPSRHRIDIL